MITGGGPAGCFAALRLRKERPAWRVTVIERRGAEAGSARGCAFCAGVLSEEVTSGLEELGLRVPEETILSRLRGIRWFLPEADPVDYRPTGEMLPTVSRGGLRGVPSFDHWLQDQVAAAGAELRRATVTRIDWADPGWRAELGDGDSVVGDRAILAHGLNGPVVGGQWAKTVRYAPPRTARAIQVEVTLHPAVPDDEVLVFTGFHQGVDFLGVTPKGGGRATLTGIGRNARRLAARTILETPPLSTFVKTACPLECSCRPRYVETGGWVAAAHGLLVAGDLLASRFYKNGIGSAYYTGTAAAEAVMENYGQRYLDQVSRRFSMDNRVARALFWACGQVSRRPVLQRTLRRSRFQSRLGPMAWAIFQGTEPYLRIAGKAVVGGWK